MKVGMKLINIHTGTEVEIVGVNTLASKIRKNGSMKGSRLSETVYVLEYQNEKRENWNAIHMHSWNIVGDEEE